MPNREARIALVEVFLPVLATLAVTARVLLRQKYHIALRWDDYTLCIALPFAWGCWAGWYYACANIVPDTISNLPKDLVTPYLAALWGYVFCYVFGVNIVRIAILLFYYRAFGVTPKIRRILHLLFAIQIAYSLMRLLSQIFGCFPTENFWERPQECKPHLIWYMTTETVGLLHELALLVFPMPIVLKTTLPWKRKVVVMAVFCGGAIAFAASIVRSVLTAESIKTRVLNLIDSRTMQVFMASNLVEFNVGIVVGSIIAMQMPLRNLAKALAARLRAKRKPVDAESGIHLRVQSEPSKGLGPHSDTMTYALASIDKDEDLSSQGAKVVSIATVERLPEP